MCTTRVPGEKASGSGALLSKVKLTTDLVSKMTFALVVKKLSPADYAKQWAKENAKLVDSWMK